MSDTDFLLKLKVIMHDFRNCWCTFLMLIYILKLNLLLIFYNILIDTIPCVFLFFIDAYYKSTG
ncbi:hypothetical protein Gromo_00469 [Candidatus Gromoviella agglomerans]|nr:hypothetical protein Gromo_00469 [Candidatus Gromoviella agglomerans]